MSLPKFRAWDKKAEVMREIKALIWEENNLIAHCPPGGHEYNEWFTVVLQGCEYQLMQSTGLKDKNGVEIFEGDVVHYTSSIVNKADWYKKIVRHGSALLMVSFDERSRDSLEFLNVLSATKGIEVIGNVWENPELLEVAEWN